MLVGALRVLRKDPATFVFTGAALLVLLFPFEAAGALFLLPPALVDALFRWMELFFLRGGVNVIKGLIVLGAPVFVIVWLGGMLSCAILACAVRCLRGQPAGLWDGLAAMARNAGRVFEYALILASESQRNYRLRRATMTPVTSLALVVMVAEDVDAERALERAQALEKAGALPEAEMREENTASILLVVLAAALGLGAGVLLWDRVGSLDARFALVFGLPIVSASVFGVVIATLDLVVLAAQYVQAVGEKDARRGLREMFPGLA